MNIDVSALPEEHREWVEGMVRNSIDMLSEVEQLSPVAFIHSTVNKCTDIVALDFDSKEGKNACAAFLRFRCAEMHANSLLFITEGWALPKNKMDKYRAIVEKYGSVGESPYRIDTLMFSLETAVTTYFCSARIEPIPPSKKKRRLAEDVKFISGISEGRFSQFLSPNTEKKSKH